MGYLESYISTLSAKQQEIIKQLLADHGQLEDVQSDAELARELRTRLEKMTETRPTQLFRHQIQTGKIDSRAYNEELKSLYIDLNTLFSESLAIDRALYDHHRLNLSAFTEAQTKLKQIEDKVKLYNLMLDNAQEYVIPMHEDFMTRTIEEDPNFYFGLPKAHVDLSLHGITLPLLANHNAIRSEDGEQTASISVVRYVGKPIEKIGHTPDMAIDGSDKTFWAEVVLSNAPLDIPGAAIADELADINKMAGCWFEVVFDYTSPLSYLILRPYSEFPLTIYRVQLFESSEATEPIRELVPAGQPIESDEPIVLQFPETPTQKVRFIIGQRHFVLRTYSVSTDKVNDLELWRQMKVGSDMPTTFLDSEMTSSTPGWSEYQTAMAKWHQLIDNIANNSYEGQSVNAVSNMLPGEHQELLRRSEDLLGERIYQTKKLPTKQLTRYEYTYGFYDIKAYQRQYGSQAVYVSRPLQVQGNIKEVALTTEEEMPEVEVVQKDGSTLLRPIGSVEWYIGCKNQWFPILPESINGKKPTFVRGERCILTENRCFALRFPVDANRLSEIQLYADGVKIDQSEWESSLEHDGTTGIVSGQVPKQYAEQAITVDYPVSTSAPYLLDLVKLLPLTTIEEEFLPDGVQRAERTLELSHYPFVHYSYIFLAGEDYDPNLDVYVPIRIRLSGKNFVGTDKDEIVMKSREHIDADGRTVKTCVANCTDYYHQVQPLLYPVQEDDPETEGSEANWEYQFRHKQNRIVFADGLVDKTAHVEYSYLADEIRVRAVLIRNLPGHSSLTPIVRNYTAKVKIINQF